MHAGDVMARTDIAPACKVVYSYLTEPWDQCPAPTLKHIATRCGISISTTQRAVNRLKALNLISSRITYKSGQNDHTGGQNDHCYPQSGQNDHVHSQNDHLSAPAGQNRRLSGGQNDHAFTLASEQTPKRQPPPNFKDILNTWNATCPDLPQVLKAGKKRKELIIQRLRDDHFAENWPQAAAKLQESPFTRGQNNTGWKATFDWLFANDTNYLKALEGNYDRSKKGSRHHAPPKPGQRFDPDYKRSLEVGYSPPPTPILNDPSAPPF